MEHLILIRRLFEFWPDLLGTQHVLQVVVNDLGYDLDQSHILGEVSNTIDINVYTFLFRVFPELSCSVLLFIVWDELGCVLTILIRIKYREVNKGVEARAWILIKVSKTNRWLHNLLCEGSKFDLAILHAQIVNVVSDWHHLAGLLVFR